MKDIKTIVFLTGFTLFIQTSLKGNTQVGASSQEIEPLRSLLSYVLKNHQKKKHNPPRYKVFTKAENDDSMEIKENSAKSNREVTQISEIRKNKDLRKTKEARKTKSVRIKDNGYLISSKDLKENREIEKNREGTENADNTDNREERERRIGRENILNRDNRENLRNTQGREPKVGTENRESKGNEDVRHNKNDRNENKYVRDDRENRFILKHREVKENHEGVDKELPNNKEKKEEGEFAEYRAFRLTKEKEKSPEKHKLKRKKLWKKKIEKGTKLPPHVASKEADPKLKKHKQKIDNIIISSEVNDLVGGKDVNITKTIGLDKPVDIIVHIKMNK